MKKLLVLPILLFLSFTGFAQLKVLSNGDTFIPKSESLRITSSSGTGSRIRLIHHGGNDAVFEYYRNLYFNTGSSSSSANRIHTMVLSSTGDVTMRKILKVNDRIGIGRYPSSSFKLDVNGKARIGTVTYSSDKRYKENIKPMKGDLEKVKKLKPVSYQYKDEVMSPTDTSTVASETSAINGRRKKRSRMGFVAQDFQKLYPELVHEDENGYLSIDYISMIPVLVETLQEQQEQIDRLKKKIKKLSRSTSTKEATNDSE